MLRLSDEEWTRLLTLAKEDMRTSADYVRVHINREYERRHKEEAPHRKVHRDTKKRSPRDI
jgi:predicted DNA-binding protein